MLSQSVKIDVPLENGKKWEKIYSKDDKIQSIIDDFKNENGYHIPKKYTMKWLILKMKTVIIYQKNTQ